MSPSVQSHLEKKEFASELKFLLDPARAELVRVWAREQLVADPNAGGPTTGDTYAITSLYFDNTALDVFHRRHRMHLSKYRVRRYGGPDGPVFLERKLKARGRLAKRRFPVTAEEIALVAAPVVPEAWAGRWFHTRVVARRLRPICEISYDRLARVLLTAAGPIRLTMDTRLRARSTAGLAFQDDGSGLPLASDQVVLELKYRRELPVLFRELVARFQLSPQPFSKYRTAVTALELAATPADRPNATATHTPDFPAPLTAYA